MEPADGRQGLQHLQRCSVCDLAKIFFTSKFSYVLFCNPTHKTETGTANRWGTTSSTPANRNTEQVGHIYYSFLQVQSTAALFTRHSNASNYVSQNHFTEPNRHTLDFLHRILLCRITYRAPLEML